VRNDHTRPPELTSVTAGGLSFAVWDWPGDDPALLFAHGTGFHGRCWDPVIRRFPSQRCMAIEARGHGRSSKPRPPYRWGAFGPDMLVVLGRLGVRGAIGIGHSMGGHTVTAASVRRRRARFSSAEEMFEHYRHRPPFESWEREVLRDYCDFGLLSSDGEFVLACPPEVEASIYECSKEAQANLHAVIPSLMRPVTVLRAGYSGPRTFSRSPTDPHLASRFPYGREVLAGDHSHFIPMEAPELVADEIRRFL